MVGKRAGVAPGGHVTRSSGWWRWTGPTWPSSTSACRPPTPTRAGGGAAHPRALSDDGGCLGYLLKERVSDIAILVDALRRVTEGECVLDPTIVARLMQRRRPDSPLTYLTQRERDILALMA
jgi:DNA-binding CsgD family transcriptional regulator